MPERCQPDECGNDDPIGVCPNCPGERPLSERMRTDPLERRDPHVQAWAGEVAALEAELKQAEENLTFMRTWKEQQEVENARLLQQVENLTSVFLVASDHEQTWREDASWHRDTCRVCAAVREARDA